MLPRLLHIALAALLLVSSAGANVSTHLCGGVAVEWSVYVVAEDCGMGEGRVSAARDGAEPIAEPSPCCEDELTYHQLDVDQQDADAPALDAAPIAAFAKTAPPYPAPAAVAAAPAVASFRARPPPEPLPQRARLAALRVRRI